MVQILSLHWVKSSFNECTFSVIFVFTHTHTYVCVEEIVVIGKAYFIVQDIVVHVCFSCNFFSFSFLKDHGDCLLYSTTMLVPGLSLLILFLSKLYWFLLLPLGGTNIRYRKWSWDQRIYSFCSCLFSHKKHVSKGGTHSRYICQPVEST